MLLCSVDHILLKEAGRKSVIIHVGGRIFCFRAMVGIASQQQELLSIKYIMLRSYVVTLQV